MTNRWIIFAPVAILSIFASPASAQVTSGVSATFYDNWTPNNIYNNAPPIPPTSPIAGTEILPSIDQNYDQSPQFNLYEDFVVKYEGFLTAPTTGYVQFMAQADDGTQFYLDNNLITNDWYDKGGGGSVSAPVYMIANESVPFTLWFYENGGGAWIQFWWMHDNTWEIVPPEAFSLQPQPLPTTTFPTSTSIQETTTTTQVSNSTISSIVSTTLQLPNTTTTEMPASTTTESSTTTSSSTTTTTTTEAPVPYVPSETTTTMTTSLETTTTTESPLTPFDTVPDSVPVEEPSTIPSDTLGSVLSVDTTESVPFTIPESAQPVLTNEEFNSVVSALANPNVTPEEVQAVVELLVSADLTQEQAVEVVTNPDVIQNITGEQATELFSEVSANELTEAEGEAIVEAVQDAPVEVREAFETELDVFQGSFDNYVPIGSVVSVKGRRILNAVTATLFVLSAPVPTASASAKRRD